MKTFNYILKGFIYAYKICISPYMISHCRFNPSCSTYALNALNSLPLIAAIVKIIKRIAKCHPFNANLID